MLYHLCIDRGALGAEWNGHGWDVVPLPVPQVVTHLGFSLAPELVGSALWRRGQLELQAGQRRYLTLPLRLVRAQGWRGAGVWPETDGWPNFVCTLAAPPPVLSHAPLTVVLTGDEDPRREAAGLLVQLQTETPQELTSAPIPPGLLRRRSSRKPPGELVERLVAVPLFTPDALPPAARASAPYPQRLALFQVGLQVWAESPALREQVLPYVAQALPAALVQASVGVSCLGEAPYAHFFPVAGCLVGADELCPRLPSAPPPGPCQAWAYAYGLEVREQL